MGFICRIENWMFWTSTKRAYRTAPTRIVPFAVACAMLDVWSTTASKSGSVPMYLEDIIRRYWTLCALPWQFPIFCRCPNLRKLISRWLTTKLFILPRTEEQLVTDLLRLVDNWSYFDFLIFSSWHCGQGRNHSSGQVFRCFGHRFSSGGWQLGSVAQWKSHGFDIQVDPLGRRSFH